MFRHLLVQMAARTLVPKLARTKPFIMAAQFAHKIVQEFTKLGAQNQTLKRQASTTQTSQKDTMLETFTIKQLEAMSMKELKDQIAKHGRSVPKGAFEKSEFQAVLRDLAKSETIQEETQESLRAMFARYREIKDNVKATTASLKEDAKADWKAFKDKLNA